MYWGLGFSAGAEWSRQGLTMALLPQDVTLQHYMDYRAESLIPVMAHIAKNVIKVNEGRTKHMVSWNGNFCSNQLSIDAKQKGTMN